MRKLRVADLEPGGAMANGRKRKVAVLGASGGVGQLVVDRALAAGYDVVCQTRSAQKLAGVPPNVQIHEFDPRDCDRLREFVKGAHVVVFALGVDTSRPTTLFSDVTKALVPAMSDERVRRLIAITGVGVGETRGHGGFFYDKIIYPLFTRNRYADKARQEAEIEASDLDWVIVRPAPFSDRRIPGDLAVYTEVPPGVILKRVTRSEVAEFIVEQFESNHYVHQHPFIGHP